jgi:hypothetical protein
MAFANGRKKERKKERKKDRTTQARGVQNSNFISHRKEQIMKTFAKRSLMVMVGLVVTLLVFVLSLSKG